MHQDLPDWVQRNPGKYLTRLQEEAKYLYSDFPNIGIFREGPVMYLEGPVLTMSKNQYTVRIVYPENYPHVPPSAYVRDIDVAEFAGSDINRGHKYHNYGIQPPHGLALCLLGRDDQVNKGWTPTQSGVTILQYAVAWLNAFEYKQSTGQWPLPETH